MNKRAAIEEHISTAIDDAYETQSERFKESYTLEEFRKMRKGGPIIGIDDPDTGEETSLYSVLNVQPAENLLITVGVNRYMTSTRIAKLGTISEEDSEAKLAFRFDTTISGNKVIRVVHDEELITKEEVKQISQMFGFSFK